MTGISRPTYRRANTFAWLRKSNAALFGKTIVLYFTVGASIDALGFLLAAGGLLTTSKLNPLIVPASMFVHYRQLQACSSFQRSFCKVNAFQCLLAFRVPCTCLSGLPARLINSLPFRYIGAIFMPEKSRT